MYDIGQQWIEAMRRGDDAAAWRLSDRALATRDPADRDDPRLPYHRRWVWDGRRFRDRHVLVRCYHGLGDTLQYARYLAPLRSQVESLTLEAQPALLELLADVAGPDHVVPFAADAPLAPLECDIEIMELPHALRLRPQDVTPLCLRAQADRLPTGAVGFCWQAAGWDRRRDIPAALIAPLAARCVAYTLQPAPTGLPVRNPAGCPQDIAATAALMAGMSLIVTVDTMVAHLAGALGRPTWLLLQHAADWRWMRDHDSTPWYPTMRLYRQPAPGDWHSVVARLRTDLMARG